MQLFMTDHNDKNRIICESRKKMKKTKKRLTGRGKFGNIDKLSQGAELPMMETKKDEKSS